MTVCARRAGRPTRREAAGIEHRILDAALAVFSRAGIAGASIEEIAATSGVTKHTIYRRYLNKTVLLDAVVARDLALLAAMLAEERERAGTALDGLRVSVERLFAYAITPDRARFLAFLAAECAYSPDMQRKMEAWEALVLAPLVPQVAAAQAAGLLAAGDPRAQCLVLLDLIDGLARRMRRGCLAGDRETEGAAALAERWAIFLGGCAGRR